MKNFILLFVLLMFICSCSSEVTSENGLVKLKGGKYAGGIFRINEVEDYRSLYPFNITNASSYYVSNQIYEGLVKFSQTDLSILPAVAESWTKNEDATIWTFKIRKNVKFHNDECFKAGSNREVKAKNIKWCLDKLCEISPHNQIYGLTFKNRVKGANEYYQSTIDKKPLSGGVSGIKVIDDYTLEISLTNSFAGFLNILAIPYIFPKEAFDKYGEEGMRNRAVGTGAFTLETVQENEIAILNKNPEYWGKDTDGNQLPYLDVVRYSFIKEKKQEFFEFRKGNLDMLYRIPTENIGDILTEFEKAKENKPFELQVCPAMDIFYYGFLNPVKPFNDKRVRLAFNYAIDRQGIVNNTLKGEGIPAVYGIVPPAPNFEAKGYNFKELKGYTFNPDLAKKLLAEAGYPDGKGFPTVTLQVNIDGGNRNVLVSQTIQRMLKENLNIDVNMESIPGTEHWDKLETGKALFWRAGWTADYPDPEAFLTLLYGKHIPENITDRAYLNNTRFKNAVYDSLFTLAMKEMDDTKRFDLYRQADQVAIDEGAIIPVFYDEIYRLVQKNVKDFDINGMECRDLSKVYFVPDNMR